MTSSVAQSSVITCYESWLLLSRQQHLLLFFFSILLHCLTGMLHSCSHFAEDSVISLQNVLLQLAELHPVVYTCVSVCCVCVRACACKQCGCYHAYPATWCSEVSLSCNMKLQCNHNVIHHCLSVLPPVCLNQEQISQWHPHGVPCAKGSWCKH